MSSQITVDSACRASRGSLMLAREFHPMLRGVGAGTGCGAGLEKIIDPKIKTVSVNSIASIAVSMACSLRRREV